jgi:20S proteasome alpha/beta subunit
MGRRAVKKKNTGKKGDGLAGFLDSTVWPDAPLRPVINELVDVWKLSEEKAIEMVVTALAEKIKLSEKKAIEMVFTALAEKIERRKRGGNECT